MFLIPRSSYIIKTTKEKGRGIFAAHDIEAGTIIGDYLGTIIKVDSNNEEKSGLYDMAGGAKYDIAADPKIEGVHFINHSCANNCDTYPHGGHMLFFALRKIFKGEEISINYWLYAPAEKETTCQMHACYCNSRLCTGTMHHAAANFDAWEHFVKKRFGALYTKVPGKFGEPLAPLSRYPTTVGPVEKVGFNYDIFGSEEKLPAHFTDQSVPPLSELRRRISETGQKIAFPKLCLVIDGIRNDLLLADASPAKTSRK